MFMNQIFDWKDSAPGQATVATIKRSRWIRLSSAWSRTVHLGPGAARRGAIGEKKEGVGMKGRRMWRGETWGEGRKRREVVRGGGPILQSCRLDILGFDGLAFIFTAVFLCCGGAVLKSSIFS